MLAKMMLCTTLTCARPPRKRPTSALQKRSSRSMMLPLFMNSAARMKSGIASSSEARIHAVEQLLGGGAHVEAGEQQIEDRAADHRVADRQPEHAQGDDRHDGEREGAGDGSQAGGRLGRVGRFRRLAAQQARQSSQR